MRQASTLPTIQHAFSEGGADVAYHALGSGPCVVMVYPYHVNHLALNWEVGFHREGMQFLSRFFTVVSLDFRGAGLSTRPADISWGTFVQDIEAVLGALGVERAGLCAMGPGALAACRFASAAPERIVRMITIGAGDSAVNRSVLSLRRLNRNAEADARGALLAGIRHRDDALALAAVARAALDVEGLGQWERLYAEASAPAFAAGVEAPVLCLHAERDEVIPLAAGQAFAGALRRGALAPLPLDSSMHVWRDVKALHAMASFLLEGFGQKPLPAPRAADRPEPRPGGLSEREVEVLRLVAAGLTNHQIAGRLAISLHTVSHHLRNIFAKTSAANRTEAAAFAHRHSLG